MRLTNAEKVLKNNPYAIRTTRSALEKYRKIDNILKPFHGKSITSINDDILLAMRDYPQMLNDLTLEEEKLLIKLKEEL